MNRHNSVQKGLWSGSVLAVLLILFLLFWEWLRPLPVLTDTHSIRLFLLVFLSVLLLKFFKVPNWIHFFVVTGLLLFLLNHLFYEASFFSTEWFALLKQDLVAAIPLMFQREWLELASAVRTLFFFLFIWYTALFLYHTAVHQQRLFLFFILTVVYVSIIDTFTPYDGRMAILRTFIFGFLLLSLSQMLRIRSAIWAESLERSRSREVQRPAFPFTWLVGSIAFVLIVTTIGYAAPKAAPSWPDPVSFIQSLPDRVADVTGSAQVQRSGYGGSDTILGGPFIQDHSIVFRAQTQGYHYWRGESSDIYTGKGWEKSVQERFSAPDGQLADIWSNAGRLYAEQVAYSVLDTTVRFEGKRYNQLFYPGDFSAVHIGDGELFVQVQAGSGKVDVWTDQELERPFPLSEYSMQTQYPHFSEEQLLKAEMNDVPADILNRYTQLPATLPPRVKELAVTETEHLDTAYEKVKWIESYFLREQFVYEIEDVPVPERGQDYVDQFLFDTQRGYCDNFSSAMVVMLRTLDIPARWVKGFTAGEDGADGDEWFGLSGELDDGETRTAVVRNSDAHSWVEVYFPGSGWVPFEPTRTFSNPFSFAGDEASDREETETEADADADLEQPHDETDEQAVEDKQVAGEVIVNNDEPSSGGTSIWKWVVLIASVVVLSACVLLFVLRRRVVLKWAIYRYQQGDDEQWLFGSYETLIRCLGLFFHRKSPSQTMREYVASLEPYIDTADLKPLTLMFESVYYGKQPFHKKMIRQVQNMWYSMMKKI